MLDRSIATDKGAIPRPNAEMLQMSVAFAWCADIVLRKDRVVRALTPLRAGEAARRPRMNPPASHPRGPEPAADSPQAILQPGFRNRLIEALDRVGVPASARQAYVASLTSRAPQTVNRWFDRDRPGLPDLESFVRLCAGLRCSSDSLLDLRPDGGELGSPSSGIDETTWAREIFQSMRCECADCDVVRMRGDEMAPIIRDGDVMFVDRGLRRILGSGIYALELAERTVVRRVEAGLGVEVTLRCEQPGYREHVVADEAAAARMGLRVLGKVFAVVGVTRFRRG